jgi:hypothetical protein
MLGIWRLQLHSTKASGVGLDSSIGGLECTICKAQWGCSGQGLQPGWRRAAGNVAQSGKQQHPCLGWGRVVGVAATKDRDRGAAGMEARIWRSSMTLVVATEFYPVSAAVTTCVTYRSQTLCLQRARVRAMYGHVRLPMRERGVV